MENLSGGNRPDEAPPTGNSMAWQDSRISSPRQGGAFESSSPRRRNDESWVEIASQPSSSSLSSIGDEIVTTGLRVTGGLAYPPRRRRLQQQHGQQHQGQPPSMPHSYLVSHRDAHTGASGSQEEYEETESEEDNLNSRFSTARRVDGTLPHLGGRQHTAIPATTSQLQDGAEDGDYDDDSDDGNSTALGRPSTSPVFRPQPNAFSHPPSHLAHRHSTPGSISGPTHPYGNTSGSQPTRRSSYSRGGGGSRNAPHFMSPSYREDNDAALRASLTTLLSCAAAARGLPKRDEPAVAGPSSNAAALQPMGLRLVAEADLMSEAGPLPSAPALPSAATDGGKLPAVASATTAPPLGPASAAVARPAKSSSPSSHGSSTSPSARGDKSKRAASGTTAQRRATKKKRISDPSDGSSGGMATATATPGSATFISPSLLTWVVSAGVVVLVSVVGFGAGYVIGREVGRQEGAATAAAAAAASSSSNATAAAAGSCGREIARSTTTGTLRRFRWGSMARSAAA